MEWKNDSLCYTVFIQFDSKFSKDKKDAWYYYSDDEQNETLINQMNINSLSQLQSNDL